MGVAVGDYDNDGYLDLFVTSFGPETLFHNNGDGTFTDVTAEAGVSDPLWSTSAAFIDYDRDGDLDLFVANYSISRWPRTRCVTTPSARAITAVRARIAPCPIGSTATRATAASRTSPTRRGSARPTVPGSASQRAITTVMAGSISTWPTTPRQISCGSIGTTERSSTRACLSGAAVNAAGNPEGSMGIASGDFDRDGDEDLFVTNIIGETFALYVNDGKGNFEDARVRTGLAAPTAA